MGLHTETEIYRTTYDLFTTTTEAIRNMPRDVKVHMGGKIRDEVLDVIDAIYMANAERGKAEKLPHIESARRRILRVEVLLRQAGDSHHDRALLANVLRARGFVVNGAFTQTYR